MILVCWITDRSSTNHKVWDPCVIESAPGKILFDF